MISIPNRIPIHVFPLFWVLIVLIGWLNTESLLGTAIWGVIIFFSVLIHEYGHALTALAFGQEAEINLVGLGGLTKRTGQTIKSWQEFFVILNGPLAGFALCLIISQVRHLFDLNKHSLLAYSFEVAIEVNLFWNILNLLPIFPLDGGQLMRVLFEGFMGIKGFKIALIISIIIATLASLVFFLSQALLPGALFLMLAFESYRTWSDIKYVTPLDTKSELQDLYKDAEKDLNEGRDNEAFSKFLTIREQSSNKGVLYILATEAIAHLLAKQGHLKQSYEWLLPIENRLSAEYLHMLHQLAYRLQEWEQAVRIGTKAYQKDASADTALLNSLSYAILGQAKPSVGWLRCAIQAGLVNTSEIIKKREFDAVRASSEFQDLAKRITL